MKHLLVIFALTVALLPPAAARADHHLVQITSVFKISNTSCGMLLTITGDDQDEFVAGDNIALDDAVLTNFAALVTAGINDDTGNNDTGDAILAVSATLAADPTLTIDPDLSFADASCADFDADAEFTFNIFEANALSEAEALVASDFPGFGGADTAIVTTNDAGEEVVDLTVDAIAIANNSGQPATIGTEVADEDTDNDLSDNDVGANGGSGCQINGAQSAANISLWSLILLGLGVVFIARFQDPL